MLTDKYLKTSSRLADLNRRILSIYRESITTPNSVELDALCHERDAIQTELQTFFSSITPTTENDDGS